jgi:chorismate dehydratase
VQEVAAVPTELNRMLASRELDVANVSSVEYANNPESYVLLPSLCVGSDGAVESVQLVTQLPLPAVQSIAVTSASATSVALVRVLVPHAEIRPEGSDADARLLIGDEALSSAFSDPTPHHDLGALWRERTGLPMVFAVWAAQRDCDPDALARVDRALRGAVAEASEHADLVAKAAGERHGFPAGYLARYFEKLRYGFGERERAGLERFYSLAAECGAIPGVPELRFAATARVR